MSWEALLGVQMATQSSTAHTERREGCGVFDERVGARNCFLLPTERKVQPWTMSAGGWLTYRLTTISISGVSASVGEEMHQPQPNSFRRPGIRRTRGFRPTASLLLSIPVVRDIMKSGS